MPKSHNQDSPTHVDDTLPAVAESKSLYDSSKKLGDDLSPLTVSEVISYESDMNEDSPRMMGPVTPMSYPSVRFSSGSSTAFTDGSTVASSISPLEGGLSFSGTSVEEDPAVFISPLTPMSISESSSDRLFASLSYAPGKEGSLQASGGVNSPQSYNPAAKAGDAKYLQNVSRRLSFSAPGEFPSPSRTIQFGDQPSAFRTPQRDSNKKDGPAHNGLAVRGSSSDDDEAFPDLRLDDAEGVSLFTDDPEHRANKTVRENHKRTMYQFANTLGYFPTMEEWDEILAELGGVDKITVGKTSYNVHVAKDFLVTFRNAFCYLGRTKPVKHDPHLFTTLVEELEGKQFNGKDHAIKAWTDVFMNFNAVRIVLAMKIDKLKKEGRPSEGAEGERPVINKLMRYLDLVREFEKDVWHMMPEEKRELVRRHFSKNASALNHLKGVDVLSPPRASPLDRSSPSPLMDVSRSSPDSEVLTLFPVSKVSSPRHTSFCEELRRSPVMQRVTYASLTGCKEGILGKQSNVTPSQTVVNKAIHIALKNKKNGGSQRP